jgi:hypothetical protein
VFGANANGSQTQPGDSPLARNLAEANARWVVREMPFTSQAPLVGRLIVAVRSFWNWMSTKWYVRAILQQQNGFNGTAVQAMNELSAVQDQLRAEHSQLRDEVRRLGDLVEEQQAEIDRLRGRAYPTQ